MKRFQMLEHTGDIKMRVSGKDLPELFTNAALGMMAFLYGEEALKLKPAKTETIAVESADLQSLLVDWLSELLYLSDENDRAYTAYHITELTDKKIAANVGSISAEAKDDIKAVTYHELVIEKRDGQLEATIVFDI